MNNVSIREDHSEKVRYDSPDYLSYVRKSDLSIFPNRCALSHWHDDIELIAVLSGSMQYNVNGSIVTLNEGEGIFVNAKQIHHGFSETGEDCNFICILLHPVLLCQSEYIENTFVNKVLLNKELPFCHLSPKLAWQAGLLEAIKRIYENRNATDAPLWTQCEFYRIWALLYENLPHSAKNQTNTHLSTLKKMLLFIEQNYTEKIALANVAKSGAVSVSYCGSIFKQYLHKSPVAYLIEYRLQKSVELLRDPEKNITEIAYEVGFNGTSYYIETFRKAFNTTPQKYRKEIL